MNNKLYKLMNWPEIEGIVYSEESRPHELLGPHASGTGTLIQTFQPEAAGVKLKSEKSDKEYQMELVDEAGYFACLIPEKEIGKYVYRVSNQNGNEKTVRDAYQYLPDFLDSDKSKINHGIHYTVYEKLGAHQMTMEGIKGTYFALWAPNALRVSVVGDFNHWDGRVHQMSKVEECGIFEIFIPDVGEGECYKYELRIKGGLTYLKSDPYAFAAQLRPDTASIVVKDKKYAWKDDKWMKERGKKQQPQSPISVYEIYLGSFLRNEKREYCTYQEISPRLIAYVKEMGYTHVEFLPVMEHPLDQSWGYQVNGYYAPTARYGSPEGLKYLIDELHQADIGVILDWVPAHFPRDTYGLSNFDGTCLYEHLDPRKGTNPHLGTLLYNYARPQVSNYLIANALFWVEKYHADGIRMDDVASMLYLDYGKNDGEWVANIYGGNENLEAVEFIKHLNSIMKKRNPDVLMIAEESTAWSGVTGSLDADGLGFDLKWNMGFMNDYLRYIAYDPYFRSHHHSELTFSMIYAYSERFMLVFSHDEVVHGKATMIGKMPGNKKDKFANLRLTYGYMMTHPGKKLLFMGQDIAEFDEFNEERSVEWDLLQYEEHQQIKQLMADLNQFYRTHPALYLCDEQTEGFEWLNCISAEQCMLSYMRKTPNIADTLVVVANFANVEQKFTIGVPMEGKYKEIFTTSLPIYGGAGTKNTRIKSTMEQEYDGKPYSFKMVSAPLSVSIFQYTPYTEEEKGEIEERKIEKTIAKEQAKIAKSKAKVTAAQKKISRRKKA